MNILKPQPFNNFILSLALLSSCHLSALAADISTSCPSSGGEIQPGVTITSTCNISSGALIVYGASGVTQSGAISVSSGGYEFGNGVYNTGNVSSLTNAGIITSSTGTAGVENAISSTITTLNNTGTISGPNGIWSRSLISNLINSGTITSSGALTNAAVYIGSNGRVTNLVNSGTISGATNGVFINLGSAVVAGIDTLTNTGIISGTTYGINNNSGVSTKFSVLNNQQGARSSALTYTGYLPTNYNIIIKSPVDFGRLAVTNPTGSTTFGIYSGGVSGVSASTLAKGTYSSVLSGITSSNLTGATSGNYDGFTWALSSSSGSIWDLIVTGASTADTQQSLVNTAAALQNTYALQNSVLANSFSYDCPVFGAHNVCVSAGGRNTAVSAANGLNNTSALLIAAYRIKPTLRIGAYADQNLSVNNAGSTVNLGNSTPLIGLFGVWNQRIDGTGTEVKVAAAYGQKNTTVNRQVVGTSEAGNGSSNLNSQGAQITAKYGFAVAPEVLVSPYLGVRYTQNNMGGYTESASATVTAPLTYSALNTNTTTALAGVGASYRFIPKATLFASAGVETDTNTSNGTYSATGITGLTPVNFNPNPVKTRPTATLGAYYDIVKNQRIGITGIYRQESYQAISTTTVLATYTIGL